jgi:HK97 family phage major capsid protein
MEGSAMSSFEFKHEPWEILGYRKNGTAIFPIAGATEPDPDDGDGGEENADDVSKNRLNKGNIYRNLQEIERRQTSIRSELGKLDKLDDPTDEDLLWQGTLIDEYDDLETRAQPLRKRHAELKRIQEAASKPSNNEKPEPSTRSDRWGANGPDFVPGAQREDPFRQMDRVRQHAVPREELYDRARYVIEDDSKRGVFQDEHAEVAMGRVERARGTKLGADLSAHVLLTGSKEYRDAFDAYLRDPAGNSARAALSLTNANGGFLLPYVLDPTIILTNNSSANPYRRISRTVQTTSNAWQGVNSAGVNAAMLAEAAMATDNSPTVGQIQIFPEKAAAWVYGSYEAMEDEDFARQLPMMIADAKDRLEEAQFTTGAGHGSQAPLGLLSALGTGQRVVPVTTGAMVAADVYALLAAVPPRFRKPGSANWLANIAFINKIRGIDTAGGSSFWANFGQDQPEQLLGKGIYEESSLAATNTTATGSTGAANATLVFGDFQQFLVVDRVGVSMLYEPMVKGASATASGSPGFPTGQAGWFAFWRFSSGVSTAAAFRYLTQN